MDCSEVREKIDQLIDFELPSEERKAVREHIADCVSCRQAQDQAVLLKRMIQLKARRPEAPAGLASGVRRLFIDERRRVRIHNVRRVSVAAAVLLVATGFFFFLSISAPAKLDHHAAAEGCVESFLRRLGAAESLEQSSVSEDWQRRLRQEIREEMGVELSTVPVVPNSKLLGWHEEEIGGHKAIRLDFRPLPEIVLTRLGTASNTLVSVFLLPIDNTDFPPSFLEELARGHRCDGCVRFTEQGTVYCLRRDDVYVAAVSNVGASSFVEKLQPR